MWEPQRIDHDYAFAVAANDDFVFYSSSADHSLHALNLDDGKEKWRFITGGPVRLAADFYKDTVLFGSDDGYLYCVRVEDGSLVWKYRPEGIVDEWMVGNEQIISRWPCRTGALVDGEHVYAGFGILAPEGTAIVCLDASTGQPIWINDTCGYRFMNRPHSLNMGGVAPEGYLAADERFLVVATGRSTPAFFDKTTGKLLYHEADGDFTGGARNMLAAGYVFGQADTLKKEFGNGLRPETPSPEMEIFDLATLVAFNPETGHEVFSLRGGSRGIISPQGDITLTGRNSLIHLRLSDVEKSIPAKASMISHTLGHFVANEQLRQWAVPVERVYSLLQGQKTILAGGRQRVFCVDADSGEITWEMPVEGQVRSMCATPEAWIVSTTKGHIYCLKPDEDHSSEKQPVIRNLRNGQMHTRKGKEYALALGEHTADSLASLAERYALVTYPTDPQRVGNLRRLLSEKRLYGASINVQEFNGNFLPYTDYFADAIEAKISSSQEWPDELFREMYRLLRPYGGVAKIYCPQSMQKKVHAILLEGGVAAREIEWTNNGLRIVRGELEGEGYRRTNVSSLCR